MVKEVGALMQTREPHEQGGSMNVATRDAVSSAFMSVTMSLIKQYNPPHYVRSVRLTLCFAPLRCMSVFLVHVVEMPQVLQEKHSCSR